MTEQYQWKDPKAAARITGHHPDTIREWARADLILARRFGRRGWWQVAVLDDELIGTNGHRPYKPRHAAPER